MFVLLLGGPLFFRRTFDCFDNLHITGTHAKVAGERLADFRFGRIGIALQQRVARHHHSRRAVAALKSVMFDEGFLNRAQLAVLGEAFDGRDFPAVRLHREMEAGFNDFAVEQNRAGAAFAHDAADVRASEADIFAQKMREQNTWLHVFLVEPAIDGDADCLFHKAGEYL
jgi:hypothetical protein